MRLLAVFCLVAVAISGCASEDEAPEQDTTTNDANDRLDQNQTGDAPLEGNVTREEPTASPQTAGNATAGNQTTVDGNATLAEENGTVDPVPEEVVLHEQHWEGTAPAAVAGTGAVFISGSFPVAPGATSVHLIQVSEYIGIVAAVFSVDDPTGEERAIATDDCGWTIMPGALETYTCEVSFEENLVAGEWTWNLTWQVGEVAETYTVDATVTGYAAA